ncbi:MAG: hypothetical protein ABII22_04665 [Candidatus Micrarchaeota archaeon]
MKCANGDGYFRASDGVPVKSPYSDTFYYVQANEGSYSEHSITDSKAGKRFTARILWIDALINVEVETEPEICIGGSRQASSILISDDECESYSNAMDFWKEANLDPVLDKLRDLLEEISINNVPFDTICHARGILKNFLEEFCPMDTDELVHFMLALVFSEIPKLKYAGIDGSRVEENDRDEQFLKILAKDEQFQNIVDRYNQKHPDNQFHADFRIGGE